MVWFYVFSHFIDRIPVCDRTCGTEEGAASRVKELRARGKDAFYSNTLPRHFWY